MSIPSPKISLITSVLNAESSIVATIESLFPLPDGVEWSFVDGGSTDRTLQIVKPYVPHIYSLIYPNTTLYGGFNKGAEISTGEYLMWLNSGDKVYSKTDLAKLVKVIEENNSPDVYYFHAMQHGNLYPVSNIDEMPFTFPYTHQACAIKRETFEKYNGHNITTGKLADHELAVRMWITGCKFEYVNLCVIESAPFTSCEDGIGMCLNDWNNTRNLYKKYRPHKLKEMDSALLYKLHNIMQNNYCPITPEMMSTI